MATKEKSVGKSVLYVLIGILAIAAFYVSSTDETASFHRKMAQKTDCAEEMLKVATLARGIEYLRCSGNTTEADQLEEHLVYLIGSEDHKKDLFFALAQEVSTLIATCCPDDEATVKLQENFLVNFQPPPTPQNGVELLSFSVDVE